MVCRLEIQMQTYESHPSTLLHHVHPQSKMSTVQTVTAQEF